MTLWFASTVKQMPSDDAWFASLLQLKPSRELRRWSPFTSFVFLGDLGSSGVCRCLQNAVLSAYSRTRGQWLVQQKLATSCIKICGKWTSKVFKLWFFSTLLCCVFCRADEAGEGNLHESVTVRHCVSGNQRNMIMNRSCQQHQT